MLRIDWDELDASARAVIQTKTGPVLAARTATEGKNSHLAALLDTPSGAMDRTKTGRASPRSAPH